MISIDSSIVCPRHQNMHQKSIPWQGQRCQGWKPNRSIFLPDIKSHWSTLMEWNFCCSVTLGDDEAKRRGTRKSVLERAAMPTFDACIEMLDRDQWRVHMDLATSVDNILAGDMLFSFPYLAFSCSHVVLEGQQKQRSPPKRTGTPSRARCKRAGDRLMPSGRNRIAL